MKTTRDYPFRTEKEAARFLQVTPKTLKNYRWRGDGPRYRKHGGRVVYHIDDLMAYSGYGAEYCDKQIQAKRGD